MLHLAFDTSTDVLSVAIASDGQFRERHQMVGQRHAELILPTVHSLLAEVSRSLQDVEVIGFGAGPGAFTGLRIACGVAQGLGLALGCPLVPVDAFSAIAEEVASSDEDRVFVAIDARMGEVYAAEVARIDGRWCRTGRAEVGKADSISAPSKGPLVGAGSAFAIHEPALRGRLGSALVRLSPAVTPRAAVILGLLPAALRHGDTIDPADATPFYLRDQVALTIAERARARAQGGATA